MCISYQTTHREELHQVFGTEMPEGEWEPELYRDYNGPIIIHNEHRRRIGRIGGYGMVPKRHMREGVDFATMNARDDRLGIARNYKPYWIKPQLCLIPMAHFYEPNWETGTHVRWKIGMVDWSSFAVAGLYREWGEADGMTSYAFTQITINADNHPLMNRFHKPDEEKRTLVIIAPDEYDDWLACKDTEFARSFLRPFPADMMAAAAATKPKSEKLKKQKIPKQDPSGSLF